GFVERSCRRARRKANSFRPRHIARANPQSLNPAHRDSRDSWARPFGTPFGNESRHRHSSIMSSASARPMSGARPNQNLRGDSLKLLTTQRKCHTFSGSLDATPTSTGWSLVEREKLKDASTARHQLWLRTPVHGG